MLVDLRVSCNLCCLASTRCLGHFLLRRNFTSTPLSTTCNMQISWHRRVPRRSVRRGNDSSRLVSQRHKFLRLCRLNATHIGGIKQAANDFCDFKIFPHKKALLRLVASIMTPVLLENFFHFRCFLWNWLSRFFFESGCFGDLFTYFI